MSSSVPVTGLKHEDDVNCRNANLTKVQDRRSGNWNSTSLPVPNVWVFIAQLVEHFSVNTARGRGFKSLLSGEIFCRLICYCLHCNYLCNDLYFHLNL